MVKEMVASGAQLEVNSIYRSSTKGIDVQYAYDEAARDYSGSELGKQLQGCPR